MDLRKVKKLIELAADADLAELELKEGEEAVRIVRQRQRSVQLPAPEVDSGQPAAPEAQPPAAEGKSPGVLPRVTVAAPMAGAFYLSPTPGAMPFAPVGARVRAGDVLCIIESMKMMHEIPSEVGGRISEVLAVDGEPVTAGQPLFRVETLVSATAER